MKKKISVRRHRRRTKQGSTLVSRHYRKLKVKKQADLFGKIIERQFKKGKAKKLLTEKPTKKIKEMESEIEELKKKWRTQGKILSSELSRVNELQVQIDELSKGFD
jgi:hypothetical protein